MASVITDGPHKGYFFFLTRSPIFLRVATSPDGDVRPLNMPHDTPTPEEKLECYILHHRAGVIDTVTKLPQEEKKSQWFEAVTYRHHDRQPPDKIMRRLKDWRLWCVRAHTGLRGVISK